LRIENKAQHREILEMVVLSVGGTPMGNRLNLKISTVYVERFNELK
tara:strand:- start:259 stop:396 length:138 start_codon:yes stop_codon:yes gene_type:complete